MDAGRYMYARHHVSGELCSFLQQLDQNEEKIQKEEERKISMLTTSKKIESSAHWYGKGMGRSTFCGAVVCFGASLLFGPAVPLIAGLSTFSYMQLEYMVKVDPNHLHFRSERESRLSDKIKVINDEVSRRRLGGVIASIIGYNKSSQSIIEQLQQAADRFRSHYQYLRSIKHL